MRTSDVINDAREDDVIPDKPVGGPNVHGGIGQFESTLIRPIYNGFEHSIWPHLAHTREVGNEANNMCGSHGAPVQTMNCAVDPRIER